ncbi:aldehyde dehydrogenase family protein [Streptomyces sp. NBC_01716]|uniref:aldehyde dehydrogenase family protein n=1 Tax=Streptomyces sp. NBC_01716 TaxID=2975917 RepID=UPI002E2F4C5B|nr:aldehyde dehydrogenase family protein [Streptomyces sp. NBC_01716]
MTATAELTGGRLATLFHAGGRWVQAHGEALDVMNPATGRLLGRVVAATVQDVGQAVEQARAAAPVCAALPLAERQRLLLRLRDLLARDTQQLARLITAEMGMPLRQSVEAQVGWCAEVIEDAVAMAPDALADDSTQQSVVRHPPVGVVACITPWNFPLHQILGRVAEAFAAGCPSVVKASELAPFSPLALADLVAEAGWPPGAFNLVSGGPDTGAALVAHPAVDLIAFTGSTRRGRTVAREAGGSLKRVLLELGGKSPSVVLDETHLEQAVRATLESCFFNSGQICSALTRLLVPRRLMDDVAQIAEDVLRGERTGDPLDPETVRGPLVSAAQLDRVRGYLGLARAAGTRMLGAPPPAAGGGYYVRPTVCLGTDPSSRLATEEIFGPVLSVVPYETTEQAVTFANAGHYGLSARVWSADRDRALAVATGIRAGQVGINDSPFDGRAPFGGFKHSGTGRAHGVAGIRTFTEDQVLPLAPGGGKGTP